MDMRDNGAIPSNLRDLLGEYGKVAIAYSGGADSSYLLYAASVCCREVALYTVRSQFQSYVETQKALELSRSMGYSTKVLECDVMDPSITSNGPDRCYLCKQRVFSTIAAGARADGYEFIMDGTNASDDPAARPGMAVLEEQGIISPLRLCGITKDQVRELSKKAGLASWNLPSNSCLATRIPTGRAITVEELKRIDDAEYDIRALGFKQFRVRSHQDRCVLEVPQAEKRTLEYGREDAEKVLLKYYPAVEFLLK